MNFRQLLQVGLFLAGIFLSMQLNVFGLALMGVALLMGPEDDTPRGDEND